MALLSCVVKGGYHSVSVYQWYRDDHPLNGECHPILYASQCGVYRCDISVRDGGKRNFLFTIQGIINFNVISDLTSYFTPRLKQHLESHCP